MGNATRVPGTTVVMSEACVLLPYNLAPLLRLPTESYSCFDAEVPSPLQLTARASDAAPLTTVENKGMLHKSERHF